jgi:hypothetical protein
MTEYRTLRPGLLISLSTSIDGGVDYQRIDLENNHLDDEGQQRSRWETTKVIVDPAEHAEAVQVRGKCRSLIVGVCTSTARHLLCPTDREPELRAKIVEARKLAWEFNQGAKTTSVTVSVIVSKVASNDQEAAQEISREFRQLVALAESGVSEMDKKKVQEAAAKMKDLGQVFNPDSKLQVDDAVAAFRKVARKMGKAADVAALDIDAETLAKLRGARTAFLDLDDTTSDHQESGLAAEMRQRDVRAVDFDAWDDWNEDPAETTAQEPATPATDTGDDNVDDAPPQQFADIVDPFDAELPDPFDTDDNTEGK